MTAPDAPFSPDSARALRASGTLPAGQFLQALALARDEATWRRWVLRALLALGCAQILAGILFFFAFNWAQMPPFVKFAVIAGGIIIAASGAVQMGLESMPGRALGVSASLLTGVLLAVYGQTYQTGADAWELFRGWALLILPWALLARSPAHWAFWLTVATTGWLLFVDQILEPEGRLQMLDACALAALGLIAALAVLEGASHPRPSRGSRVLRLALILAALVLLWPGTIVSQLDHRPSSGGLPGFSHPVFLAALASGGWVYGRVLRDLPALALLVLAGAGYLTVWAGWLCFDLGDLDYGTMMLFTLMVTGIFMAATRLLGRVRTWMKGTAP